jgi:NADP-dependent 3-hydroxy acid dehydrogenase YdfG
MPSGMSRGETMLLKNKVAVNYGAGGAVGDAVARAFARDGATVFATGRLLAPVEELVREITMAGGRAQAAQVDALNERAVDDHLCELVEKAGRVDISQRDWRA